MTPRFDEVADRVYVLRHPVCDVNVTLATGAEGALLVDTLSTAGQASELAAAVRAVTPLPLTLVNTHHHFDHCFGNAVLARDPPRPVYAHETVATLLRERPDEARRQAYAEMRESDPALAEELTTTRLLAPDRPVRREAVVDLGGRRAVLCHPGRGHTAGDLVVHLPDVDLLVAGDLVEESGPPAFEDAYPLEWPETLAELIRIGTGRTTVVPGHGALVDIDFVTAQHGQLTDLAWLIREGHADGAPPERVAERAPFGAGAAVAAVRRGYAELAGDG